MRAALALLLTLSAVGFAVASRAERQKEGGVAALNLPEGSAAREAAEHARTTPTTSASPETTAAPVAVSPTTANPSLAPEGSPAREAAEHGHSSPTSEPTTTPAPPTSVPAPAPTAPASSASGETLFGVHTESVATTTGAVVILGLAAVMALVARRRWVLLAIAAMTSLFAFLDIREAIHQHNEVRATLVAAAVALAVAHLAAAAIGVLAYLRSRSDRPQSL